MPEQLLTAHDVADWLRVKLETIYLLIAKEGLPGVKVGGQWRFEEIKVTRWIADRYSKVD